MIPPESLDVVTENLVGNARKDTRKQPTARIEVGVETVAGERAVLVRDNGVDFDTAYTAKLFAPFSRLHAARDFPGIGIATVQRIVHRHGGRIWADSRPGQGATCHFTLSPGEPTS